MIPCGSGNKRSTWEIAQSLVLSMKSIVPDLQLVPLSHTGSVETTRPTSMSVSTCTPCSPRGCSVGVGEDSQAVTRCPVSLPFSCSCGWQNHHRQRQSRWLRSRRCRGRRSVRRGGRKRHRGQLRHGRRNPQWRLLLWEWKDLQLRRRKLRVRGQLLGAEMCHNHHGQVFGGEVLSADRGPSEESSVSSSQQRSPVRPEPSRGTNCFPHSSHPP